jgi:hypothetical protein
MGIGVESDSHVEIGAQQPPGVVYLHCPDQYDRDIAYHLHFKTPQTTRTG